MKRLLLILLISLGISTFKVLAQDPLNFMIYVGTDGFNYAQNEKHTLTNSRISQGSFIVNPSIGLGLNVKLGSNFIIFRSEVMYGAASFTINEQKAFGSLAIPIQLGFGYYELDLYFLQLLYGYQFNFQDLYKSNTSLSSSQLNFNTHTLEVYAGYGNDKSWFTAGPYLRSGLGGNGTVQSTPWIKTGTFTESISLKLAAIHSLMPPEIHIQQDKSILDSEKTI